MAVFSQSSQTIPINGPTSLSLYKLSFCTTAIPGGKMLWTHLSGRANMFAVFDRLRSIGLGGSISESKILKLTCEADLLEWIELDNLLFQVRLDEERIKSQALQDSERYVILIVKRPMIAIRYQLPDGKIRKLQLNFLPESGFDVAVTIFASLGLPIREKASLPQPAPRNFTTVYSQSQCHIPSPSHPQDSQVMIHQPRPMRPVVTSGMLYSANLVPPHQIAQWDSYDTGPPSSAPETYSERSELPVISLSQMLPPKRALPFPTKNIKATSSDSDVATATPSQASPADSTTIVTSTTKRKSRVTVPRVKKAAATKRVRGRKTTEKSTVAQAARLNETPISSETICVPATPEAAPPSRKIVSPISPSSPRRPADNDSGPTSTEPAKPAERLPTVPDHHQPFADCDSVEPADFMSRLDTWVRKYHQSLPTPRPPAQPAVASSSSPLATANDTLALFAAQSKEERTAAIDEMICEYLGDPSFAKLVQDVEDSWKRIGLGL